VPVLYYLSERGGEAPRMPSRPALAQSAD